MLKIGNAIEKTAHRQMYPPQLGLVLQSPMTPGQFDMLKNAHVPRSDKLPAANQTECYRAQLHQVSITYCRILTYPGQMYPQIKPSSTEPYDTRSVWYVEECWHTQGRHTPTNLVLQSQRTPSQFYILKNTDVPDQ